MIPEDLKLLLKRAHFKPFSLTMSSGERFEVFHPEMLIIGRSVLALGLAKPNDPDPIADHVIWLSTDHVVKIEPLELARA